MAWVQSLGQELPQAVGTAKKIHTHTHIHTYVYTHTHIYMASFKKKIPSKGWEGVCFLGNTALGNSLFSSTRLFPSPLPWSPVLETKQLSSLCLWGSPVALVESLLLGSQVSKWSSVTNAVSVSVVWGLLPFHQEHSYHSNHGNIEFR